MMPRPQSPYYRKAGLCGMELMFPDDQALLKGISSALENLWVPGLAFAGLPRGCPLAQPSSRCSIARLSSGGRAVLLLPSLLRVAQLPGSPLVWCPVCLVPGCSVARVALLLWLPGCLGCQ
eukprot:9310788-Pyramimonas_sp.AAC.1